jgi:hypothetical protein
MKLRGFDPTEMAFGYRQKTEMEAQRMLVEEAGRLGIEAEIPQKLIGGMGVSRSVPDFMGREKLYGLAEQIRARGGTTQPGFEQMGEDVGAKLDRMNSNLEKANEQRERQQTRNAPVIQARPQVQTR